MICNDESKNVESHTGSTEMPVWWKFDDESTKCRIEIDTVVGNVEFDYVVFIIGFDDVVHIFEFDDVI